MNKAEIIASLEKERDEYQLKVQTLTETIENLKALFFEYSGSTNGISLKEKYKEYFSVKSKRQKVIAILKAENRFLHKRQIVEIVRSLEPKSVSDEEADSIASAVYALKNADLITSYSVEGSNINTFWGSKQWLDADGAIKPEYKYDEEQLSYNRAEKLEF